MVDSDSDDLKGLQNQQKLNQRLEALQFSGGEEVEVSSNEDGFGGAWYAATIVHLPPKSALKKKRPKAVVQYKTLITDDGSAHLIESVDPALIRPTPPPTNTEDLKAFEVNDAVDANYRDGWWTGTVAKVLEDSRFRVYFDNPPDVLDFDGKDLRPHFDWIDGKWVRPVVKQQTAGSVFSSGTPVEVYSYKGDMRDIWYPAIVIKENVENRTFLVKYKNSENGDDFGMVKDIVGPPHIRPTPDYADRNYELLERVDARYDFGWRAGTITKLYEGRKYIVYFRHGNENRELDHSEIRPHFEWVDGEWISDTKEHLGSSEGNLRWVESLGASESNLRRVESLSASEGNTKEKAPSTSLQNIMEQSTDYSESVPSNKKIKLATPRDNGGKGTKISRKTALVDQPSGKAESLPGRKIFVTRTGRPVKSPIRGSSDLTIVKKINVADVAPPKINGCEVTLKEAKVPLIFGLEAKGIKKPCSKDVSQLPNERLKLMRNQKNNLNNSAGEQSTEFNQQTSGRSNQKRKRGRPPKLAATSPTASDAGKEWGSVEVPNEMVVRNQTADQVEPPTCKVVDPAASDKTSEALEKGCKIMETDMAIAVAPKIVADDDQPLSILFGGMHSSAGDLRLSSGRFANARNETKETSVDEAMNSSANDACNSTPVKDLCLPFVRRSPVWKTIESMDAFQIVPQQPHFHPLAEFKEEYREGSAIGYMVTFTGLLDKISSLQLEDPRSTFESTLESLLDLERHGFDVAALQARVHELLSLKECEEELVSQSKDAEREIREHMDGKQKLHEKIKDIEKKIAELQEELSASNLEMESKDLEIARLRSHLEFVGLRIKSAGHDFENVATAPWK
uniref:Uncharacterized protein LOC105137022 isoform X3 n=1 Tax=Rhizophora mucronata TaxID=61149 RepID=A0A2P2L4G0_RHIMU